MGSVTLLGALAWRCAVIAVVATGPLRGHPALQQLDYFLGTWRCVGAPAAEVPAQRLSWGCGDDPFWSRHSRVLLRPGGATLARADWGFDAELGLFVQWQTERTGGRRLLHALGWRDDRWIWQGRSQPPHGPAATVRQILQRLGPRCFAESQQIWAANAWVPLGPELTCCRLADSKKPR